jgi:hypothetical protein
MLGSHEHAPLYGSAPEKVHHVREHVAEHGFVVFAYVGNLGVCF